MLGTDEAMSVLDPDAYSSTFLTNNLNQAAAVAAIGVLRDEDLPGRADRLGRELLSPRLGAIAAPRRRVGPVRTIGLWAGIPMRDAEGRPDDGRAARDRAGARVRRASWSAAAATTTRSSRSPHPLVIDEDDLASALDRLADVIGHHEMNGGTMELQNYVGGRGSTSSAPTFESTNPMNGETVATAPASDADGRRRRGSGGARGRRVAASGPISEPPIARSR